METASDEAQPTEGTSTTEGATADSPGAEDTANESREGSQSEGAEGSDNAQNRGPRYSCNNIIGRSFQYFFKDGKLVSQLTWLDFKRN